jgi:hypothetical protein
MRVAICFSGQLRNVRTTFEQFYRPHVLEPNQHHEIDTFVHAWYDRDTIGQSLITAGGGVGSTPVPGNVIQEVYEYYNPKTTLLQHQLPFDERNYNDNKYPMIKPKFTLSKMYSGWMSNQLRLDYETKFGFKYDVIAVARFDWAFLQPIHFDFVTRPGIYHPGLNPHGINVGYIMGDDSSINTYSNLFYDVQRVYDTGVSFCDEILAEAYLTRQNIPIFNFATPTTINRG